MTETAPVHAPGAELDATVGRMIDCLESTPCRDALAAADTELEARF